MMRQRRGMLIKNVMGRPMVIVMKTRTLELQPGEEQLVTAKEVLDAALREHLQVRSVAVVRPSTDEEEAARAATLTPNEEISSPEKARIRFSEVRQIGGGVPPPREE